MESVKGQRRGANRRRADATETPQSQDAVFLPSEKVIKVVLPTISKVRDLLSRRGERIVPGWANRLELWLNRMVAGNKLDDRTPFYRSQSWFWVRKQLPGIYTLRDTNALPKWSQRGYYKTEEDQLENIGPKSKFLPWPDDGPEKIAAVMCDKPKRLGFNQSAWLKALSAVASVLPKGSVHPITIEEALKGMGGQPKYALDPTTSGGSPGWVGDWANTSRMNEETPNNIARLVQYRWILAQSRAIVKASQSGGPDELIPLSWIGTCSQRLVQKGLDPLKSKNGKPLKGKRVVIAMPKPEVVAGKTLMAPLQPALVNGFVNEVDGSSVIAGWLPQPRLDKTVQYMLDHAERNGRTVLSGDISAFDASLPPWAMWDVAQAIATWFDVPGRKLFRSILYADVFNTTVITPSGLLGPGPSSVKSGSIFTSLMGCMCNYAIQKYGEAVGLYKIDVTHVMGDDFIIDGPGVGPESLEEAFAAFGMECNASKQFFERGSCHFLQRLHVLGLPGGMASVARVGGGALAVEDDTQLKYDERNPFAYIFQALARLENAAFNPQFTDLVEWLSRGDERYHLGRELPVESIVRRAGSYADRKLREAVNRPWTSTGSGVPFSKWSVNRVLRGEKMPAPGKERFQFVYGIPYDTVPVDVRKHPYVANSN